ncbi:MAG: alkane 1-monooxygenase [Saprospiraceae bacterium]|nr:alkane 1-monooxygenase [Saprospiraceae bacterium]
MHKSDFKYLLAYLGPFSAYISVWFGGAWSYTAVILAFGIIPILDGLLSTTGRNPDIISLPHRSEDLFFDMLLYLHVPILYGLVVLYFWRCTLTQITMIELIGMTLSVGIYVGASGINVGHELGHRSHPAAQLFSKVLLLPALYMHFFIEHNRGHHKYVCTPEDPATARYGESMYTFLIRSTIQSYIHAWKLELKRLVNIPRRPYSLANQMIQFSIVQSAYLLIVYLLFGILGLMLAIVIACIGFLLLESINYIEHYGLVRREIAPGRYERVGMRHSWNSNHHVGRIFLYELTRHADHHNKSSKKFQTLNHVDECPQLPVGYPASILMALVPPVWFSVMNERVPSDMLFIRTKSFD